MKDLFGVRRLTLFIAALMAVQALLGIVFAGEYRDAGWIVATWWGNDWVTLVLDVPLLVLAAVLSKRGSVRGLLLWAGVLAYAAYNYAYYLLGASLNRFFALYVILTVASVTALVMLLSRIDPAYVAGHFRDKTPARALGGYFMFVATGLSVIWIGTWAAFAFGGKPTPVETEAFHLVAALDLTILVPVLALGGYLLFRKRAWGYVVAAVAGIQSSLYLLVLTVNSVVMISRGLAEAPGELPIWGSLLAATGVAAAVLMGHMSETHGRANE